MAVLAVLPLLRVYYLIANRAWYDQLVGTEVIRVDCSPAIHLDPFASQRESTLKTRSLDFGSRYPPDPPIPNANAAN